MALHDDAAPDTGSSTDHLLDAGPSRTRSGSGRYGAAAVAGGVAAGFLLLAAGIAMTVVPIHMAGTPKHVTPKHATPKHATPKHVPNVVCNYTDGQWVINATTTIRMPSYDPALCGGEAADEHFICAGKDLNRWVWVPKGKGCQLKDDPIEWLNRYMSSNNSILFVGDSLARNMFESLRCSTPAAESQARLIESCYLVDTKNEHVYVDKAASWIEQIQDYSAVVLQFGHWYAHPGSRYWNASQEVGIGVEKGALNLEAFSIALNTAIDAVVAARYRGKLVISTYSPSHFFHGDYFDSWSSCNATDPDEALDIWSPTADAIHSTSKTQLKQSVRIVDEAVQNNVDKLDIRLLDVMRLSRTRPDGHPGSAGYSGKKDCAHWCLPGIPDTWNQMLYYVLA